MSIACQTWEVGSGPTVGYKVAHHQDGLAFRGYKHMHQQPTSLVNQRLAPPCNPAEDLNNLDGGISSKNLNNNMPCSSSSSIVTSSLSAESSDDEKEVQSPFKGPLDHMDSLMSTLPVRRGLSKFYTGKSRSFTSLADVKSMSIKDLAKPENPYAKRRRLPPCHKGDRFPPPRVASGISKKSVTSNGATLTLGVAMCTQDKKDEEGWKRVQKSFSLTDLQKA